MENTPTKSGMVSVIGRPNTGKSTLINTMLKQKINIVTPKPQTTRSNARAIYTDKNCQIIFQDTPGIHEPKHKLGEFMVNSAVSSLEGVDLILFITAPKKNTLVHEQDVDILEMLNKVNTAKICVLNKCDLIDRTTAKKYLKEYSDRCKFEHAIEVSAKNGFNMDVLKDIIMKYIPEGPFFYDPDDATDKTMREMAQDIVREKMLLMLSDEIPHTSAVEVMEFKERSDKEIFDIEATIYCDKESHKGIIIGKDGAMLKKIGTLARKTMEYAFDYKVNLKLWVKVKSDWRNNNRMLKDLGYK